MSARDDLYRLTPTPYVLDLPVLGLPVRFTTNAREVAAVIEDAFGAWRDVGATSHEEPIRIRILLHDGDEGDNEHAPLSYRMPNDYRVLIHSPGSLAATYPEQREAVAYVTAALVADNAHFRYGMLESITWALLTRMDRQPFHAAAIVADERALLLWGESGSGKSTLTYAAARDGLSVLTDDVVFLQSQPRLRVWGMPGNIHLPAETAQHFPELRARHATVLANGKTKLAIPIAEAGAVATARVLDRCGICILGARQPTASARRISADEALQLIQLDNESGFELFAASIRPVVRQLAARGGWLLHPSSTPSDSIQLLREMLSQVAATDQWTGAGAGTFT